MTKRLPATAAPLPLEEYAGRFDDLFVRRSQREGLRRYLAGLLLPAERNKTATGLANTEPTVGAQHPRAQELQWFLSESTWAPAAINARGWRCCGRTRRRPRTRGACWSSTSTATASGGARPRTSGDSTWPTSAKPTAASSR